ncbi:nuclear transport factor 2 family protein [Rhodopseudomonas sp. P2A-2r]|uniref:nuclear transport factor 2 family protein n=1 Tax=unclassified Rhodopseudomonas TaxID=2638247 RepID=UPI002234E512|nr:nuclear transport factor 2 family protein [Rhodopseudomonas sp. P2A-2r]UZE48245.1 nuclear transport factor 2 family protein [Rhodopseudomonas sp. P2A-2r]
MDDLQTRRCVSDFLDAFYAGDTARLANCCHDDIDSITYAPIELFPHHGQHRGKAWAAEAIRTQQERYSSRRIEITFMAVDGAKAATMLQVALQKRSDQRILSFKIADFFTLRDGLVFEHRSFFDSFDLVQQILGRDLTPDYASSVRLAMRPG